MASRPWVTKTRPIIPNSSRALRCTARMGAHSGPFEGPLQGLSSIYRRSVALRKGGAKGGLECPFSVRHDPMPLLVNFSSQDRGRGGSARLPQGQLPAGIDFRLANTIGRACIPAAIARRGRITPEIVTFPAFMGGS